MFSRRALLALPFAAACGSRGTVGYRGYAFIANQEGHAVAAVDLQAMAVARHIPLDGAPCDVLAAEKRPSIYALVPEDGSVHEIQSDQLSFKRKMTVGGSAVAMQFDRKEQALFVLTKAPHALVRVGLDSFRPEARIALPEEPVDFDLTPDGKTAAISLATSLCFADLATGQVSRAPGNANFGKVRMRRDGQALIAADLGNRRLSVYDVASERLITHLPLAVRPDHLCFSADGGQLYVTGEGLDAVVVVYPYYTPEVGQTVLAGHNPGAMGVSESFLFVASPGSGDVSILSVASQKVIAVVTVGSEPGFVKVTPDDQYALVLNGKSGDVAVLRVGTIQPNRSKSAALLTVIPVGSRPVSAAIRRV